MAYTFLKSRGVPVGKSLVEDDKLDDCAGDFEACGQSGCALCSTDRPRGADKVEASAPSERSAVEDTAIGNRMGRGHRAGNSRHRVRCALKDARTVVWNGPMGVFEIPQFAKGTHCQWLARLLR